MKYIIYVFGLLISYQSLAQQELQTGFEKNGGTSTYENLISYYELLAGRYDVVEIKKMGLTDSGHPLHMVVMDLDKHFDLEKSRKDGKTIILINNGIHPGEPDGIEACQMLLRDYAISSKSQKYLKDIVLVVIPIYNIGGALDSNKTTRVNQNGPEEYGFRGNARNFDLNRDFVKADTRNTKAFYEIYHLAKPDIFIDTHVSNGADYQYNITHLATQHDKMGGAMGHYILKDFTPQLEKKLSGKGNEITPYVNVFNKTPDAEGITQFMDYPRYSTGYTAMFNTLGFMIETHMLKSFDVRVKATYDFIQSVIEIASTDGQQIRDLHRTSHVEAGNLYPIRWELDASNAENITFKGYEGEMVTSKVTGKERLFYNRDKPFEKTIPYYNTYKPVKEVVIPRAYIIPQGWHNVIDRLKWNSALYTQLESDTTINVELYRIDKVETISNAYEGHYLHNTIQVSPDKQYIDFRKGDYIFYTDQPAGRYLLETLEPEATDSFLRWNFFDTILQQKEGFSPYVFEDLAWLLLKENTTLRQAFEQKKQEDTEFANDWYAQLYYIYTHSAYYEPAHNRYPVYRLVD